jgi:hypothetical protein
MLPFPNSNITNPAYHPPSSFLLLHALACFILVITTITRTIDSNKCAAILSIPNLPQPPDGRPAMHHHSPLRD